MQKSQFSAIFHTWHGRCKTAGMTAGWSGGQVQEDKMLSFNLQQIAVSIIGALVASSLFISAAVGPVPVI